MPVARRCHPIPGRWHTERRAGARSAGTQSAPGAQETSILRAVREKLTFSNIVALIALFVALGGSAVAALDRNSVGPRQLKKNAVITSKIRNGAVTGPKIRLSTVGKVPRAKVADTGAPLAYARVAFTGAINPAFAKNITQAMLSHPTDGVYCFDLPYIVRNGVTTMEGDAEPDDLASIEILGPNEAPTLSACPAGNDVEVRTFDTETASGPQDGDFYIELYG